LSIKGVEIITRKSPDEAVDIVNGALEKLERFLGKHALTIKFQKMFASYGGIMKARKVLEKKNFDEIQINYFQHKA
jgi:hypothetical protein